MTLDEPMNNTKTEILGKDENGCLIFGETKPLETSEVLISNTKRKVLGKDENGHYIFGEPEPLEKAEAGEEE